MTHVIHLGMNVCVMELLYCMADNGSVAWPIELLSQLSSFELAIRGVRNIIDFAVSSEAQVKLLFASTTGMIRSEHISASRV